MKVTKPTNTLAFLFIRFVKISSNPNVAPINTDAIIIRLNKFKLNSHIDSIFLAQNYLFINGYRFS
jgi:hypothetical protein